MGFLCVASPDPLFPASHKVPLSDLRILWVCIEAVEPFTIQSLVSSEIHTNFLASPYIQCVLSVILWTLLPLLSDRDLNFRLFFFFFFRFLSFKTWPCPWFLKDSWLWGLFHCLWIPLSFKSVWHTLTPNYILSCPVPSWYVYISLVSLMRM